MKITLTIEVTRAPKPAAASSSHLGGSHAPAPAPIRDQRRPGALRLGYHPTTEEPDA